MRTMFLAALFLSHAVVGMSSAYAQEAPNQTDAEILTRMAYRTTGGGSHDPLRSPAPEFGSLKTFEAADGMLKVVPSYSFTRRAEAWRPPQSGQEIQVGELALRAYSGKHPQRVYQLTGTLAQRNGIQSARSFAPGSRRDPAREKKLSVGFKRSF